jgi:hypothetical protein
MLQALKIFFSTAPALIPAQNCIITIEVKKEYSNLLLDKEKFSTLCNPHLSQTNMRNLKQVDGKLFLKHEPDK